MATINHVHSGRVEVHYFFHHDPAQSDQLARIEEKLDALKKGDRAMSVQIDALITAAQRNADAEASAAQLLKSLADEVRSLEPTQQAIDNLATTLNAQADAMAAAVVAGTIAEAPPTTGGGGTTTPTPPDNGGGTVPPPDTGTGNTPPSDAGGSTPPADGGTPTP